MADSSTGGPLVPISSPPLDDDALDDFFQGWIVGFTGLSGTLIRPRFQGQTPPNIPPVGTNWLAIGVMPDVSTDDFPAVVHTGAVGETPGFDTMIVHEEMTVLVSSYGPNSKQNGGLVRDFAKLGQNRELLTTSGMGLVSVSNLTRAPENIKGTWWNRYDLTINIRRALTRTAAILDLAEVQGTLVGDDGTGNSITAPLEIIL